MYLSKALFEPAGTVIEQISLIKMLLDLFAFYAVHLQMYYNYQVEKFFVSNTAAEIDWVKIYK